MESLVLHCIVSPGGPTQRKSNLSAMDSRTQGPSLSFIPSHLYSYGTKLALRSSLKAMIKYKSQEGEKKKVLESLNINNKCEYIRSQIQHVASTAAEILLLWWVMCIQCVKCKQCCGKPAPDHLLSLSLTYRFQRLSPPIRPIRANCGSTNPNLCPLACSSPQPPPRPPTSASFPKRKARAPSLCSSGTTTPPHRAARASGTEAAAGTRTASTRTSSAPGPAGNTVRASRSEMQPCLCLQRHAWDA